MAEHVDIIPKFYIYRSSTFIVRLNIFLYFFMKYSACFSFFSEIVYRSIRVLSSSFPWYEKVRTNMYRFPVSILVSSVKRVFLPRWEIESQKTCWWVHRTVLLGCFFRHTRRLSLPLMKCAWLRHIGKQVLFTEAERVTREVIVPLLLS